MSQEQEKQLVAALAAERPEIVSGLTIGLGSGSTIEWFVRALAARITRDRLLIRAVCTSRATEALALSLGISVIQPARGLLLDLDIDGADEVGPNLALIKGGGGALLREKVVAHAARKFIVLADSSKLVPALGRFPLPLEVIPFALPWVLDEIEKLGGKPQIRTRQIALAGKPQLTDPQLTDQGNVLVDAAFQLIVDPAVLAARLDAIPGIAEHGLFLNMAHEAMIAEGGSVRSYFGPPS